MSDITVKSDAIDVEQVMRQIRSRIREKRGVDYTEEEIRELANVKLESFLDPRGVRSDLLQQYQARREQSPALQNYVFEDTTLFESPRGLVAWFRKVLRPILKLFFNPTPLIDALHRQSKMNEAFPLSFELIHNLVLETTRLNIEVKNLKMRVESMSSRLDFDERRARALEGVVQYRPGTVPPLQPPPGTDAQEGAGGESAERRRRRRRRRRRPDQRPGGPAGGNGAGDGDEPDAGDADGSDRDTAAPESSES